MCYQFLIARNALIVLGKPSTYFIAYIVFSRVLGKGDLHVIIFVMCGDWVYYPVTVAVGLLNRICGAIF